MGVDVGVAVLYSAVQCCAVLQRAAATANADADADAVAPANGNSADSGEVGFVACRKDAYRDAAGSVIRACNGSLRLCDHDKRVELIKEDGCGREIRWHRLKL